jgi:EF hand
MLNKLSMLVVISLFVNAPLAQAESKMNLDNDDDGKVSYEEYLASKEKAHERQFKKMDTNGDGFIDADGKQAQKDKMRKMREKRKQKSQELSFEHST